MNNEAFLNAARQMDATTLETLIADLAEVRAHKSPEVPMNRPVTGVNVSMQNEPSIEARLLKDGRIRLWIRNAGLGWMAFNLVIEQSLSLRDFLIANTDQESVSALISNSGNHGNTAH